MAVINLQRTRAIAWKEFLHIRYDPRTLFLLFVFPVVELIMLGYALNMEIQRVDMAVVDYSRSTQSRRLIESFAGSPFFHLFPFERRPEKADELFKRRVAQAVLVIPADFDRQMTQNPLTSVQIIIDAADANAATLIRKYCQQILLRFNEKQMGAVPQPVDFRPAILFNPDLKSAYFFVPGIVALILMLVAALLTSVAITRERELGSMEQLLVSPVRPNELILGKVLPYIALAFIESVFIVGMGKLLFGIPFRGSLSLLALLTIVYILVGLSLGIMISTRAKTQQVAMMVANVATLLPTLLLSGLIFPIASMPEALQYLTYLVPARYYLLIVRGILLKGSRLLELWQPTLFLVILVIFLLVGSVRRFRNTLEG